MTLPYLDHIRSIQDDLDDCFRTADVQKRNRMGIDLHGKLERVRSDLLRSPLLTEYDTKAILRRLEAIEDLILEEIFKISPEQRKASKARREAKVAERLPVAPGAGSVIQFRDQFVNDDVASVTVVLSGNAVPTVSATATTKRDPVDKPDQSIGLTLAYGRALRKLGNDLIRRANGAVVEADKERRREEARKAKARSDQRKAASAAERDRDLGAYADELLAETLALSEQVDDLATTVDEQSAIIAEFRAKEEERKRRAVKKRVASRKANAATKKVTKKAATRRA